MFPRSQPHHENPFLIQRVLIRCAASRAYPRYTWDAAGAPNATKSDKESAGLAVCDKEVCRAPIAYPLATKIKFRASTLQFLQTRRETPRLLHYHHRARLGFFMPSLGVCQGFWMFFVGRFKVFSI
jgi:hypothetical protein